MTDDQIQTLRDDIAYVKALAQEGRRAPLLGGAILALAGAVFGAASLAHWAVAAEVLRTGPWTYSVVWGAAMAVFVVGLIVLSARIQRRPGASAAANRASGAAWAAVGGAVFTLMIALGILSWRLRTDVLSLAFPSMILTLYGTGWLVSGEMAAKRWIKLMAFGAFAAAVVVAILAGEPAQYLAYAAALALLALVPGLILMREEPSDVV